MEPRDIDIKMKDGLVQPGRGPSLHMDPMNPNLVKRGTHKVDLDSVPEELEIFQRGKDPLHYEVGPKNPMTLDMFRDLLNRIILTPWP